jgi:hypothetical protein
LQVRQIELELQNEELKISRANVGAGLKRYADLYDFAPVGYLTLDRLGTIIQINLAGARLLRLERHHLMGHRLAFAAFLQKAFENKAKEACEVALLKSEAVFISDIDGRFIDFNEASAAFHKFKNKDECAKMLAEYPTFIDVFMANGEPAPTARCICLLATDLSRQDTNVARLQAGKRQPPCGGPQSLGIHCGHCDLRAGPRRCPRPDGWMANSSAVCWPTC